ncbi:hypothetical protein HMPREF1526_02079, partial [Butyricicoccus pullicaecorum 1.2]
QFQSTLPMRGATCHTCHSAKTMRISIHTPHAGSDFVLLSPPRRRSSYFNPHSPCGERQHASSFSLNSSSISIHTPHAGSDHSWANMRRLQHDFNPHSPCGERRGVWRAAVQGIISIHTPHAGSDLTLTSRSRMVAIFQSTLPMRGATLTDGATLTVVDISIHTPHAGSDRVLVHFSSFCYTNFNPHSPCGERRLLIVLLRIRSYFNPHSPCGERR